MYMPPTPGPAPGLAYASFWRRVGGYLLDGLIVGVPVLILFFVLFWSNFVDYVNSASATARNGQTVVVTPTTFLPAGALIAYLIIGSAVNYLYFGFLVHSWGRTVGQAAVGVRVVPEEDLSARLPLGRATLRSTIFWVPGLFSVVPVLGSLVGLVPLVSYIMVAADSRKQGLHDKLGKALVVRPDPSAMPMMPMAPMGPWTPPPQGPPPGWSPPPQLPPGGGSAIP